MACVRAGQREGQFKPAVLQYRKDLLLRFDELCAPVRHAWPHRIHRLGPGRSRSRSRSRSAMPRPSDAETVERSGSRRSRTGGVVGYGESCPRPYVTGETLDTARAFFDAARSARCGTRSSIWRRCAAWMAAHAERDRRESRRRGARSSWRSSTLLGEGRGADGRSVPCRCRRSRAGSATPPCSATRRPTRFDATAEQYRRLGFTDFKVKLSGDLERDREKMDGASRRGQPSLLRVRVDANNLWDDADEAIAVPPRARLSVLCDRGADPRESVRRAGRASAEALGLPDHPRREPAPRRAAGAAPRTNRRAGSSTCACRRWAACCVRSTWSTRARGGGIGVIVGAQVGETSLLTRAALDRRGRASRQLEVLSSAPVHEF